MIPVRAAASLRLSGIVGGRVPCRRSGLWDSAAVRRSPRLRSVRSRVRAAALAALFLVLSPPAAGRDVTIGVLALRGIGEALSRWQPVANYLAGRLREGAVRLRPLGFDEVEPAVAGREIDFVLVNPGLYVLLESRYGAAALATARTRQAGHASHRFASVIFVSAARRELARLRDLRGRRIAAVHPRSLGGYQMALPLLREAGVAPTPHLLAFEGTHDAVVDAVLSGRADAGIVRSGILEDLAGAGRVRPGQVKVLHPVAGDGFPLARSTPLYPEWPFARLPYTDIDLAHRVAVALLTMPADGEAARAAGLAGWTAALDYRPVRELLRALGEPPFEPPSLGDFVRDHPAETGAFALFLLLVVAGSLGLLRINALLLRAREQLRREVQARLAAEEALVAERDRLRSEAEDRRQALERMALYDPLTGLPNRTLLYDRLDQELAHRRRNGRRIAVLMIDLDGFKEVNDTLGHYHGDLLLQGVAARLREAVRGSDTIARWGGDEFVMVLREVGGLEAARQAAHKVIEVLKTPIELDGLPVYVRASIGIALAPEDGEDTDTLIRRADVAMYHAKRHRTGLARYEGTHDPHTPDRLRLAADLARELDAGGGSLALWYQPQCRASDGALCAVEALLRWMRPDGTCVPPVTVISTAEQTGLIRALTLHILNSACRQWHEWNREGLRVRLAINLSPWTVQDAHFAAQFAELLDAWDTPPCMLTLEVTETALMTDPHSAERLLTELRSHGARVAIDDFGTGYSSLDRLWRLPVDEIKVDRRFVRGMDHRRNAAIVRTVVALGKELGAQVTAEGVESESCARTLRALGVDCLQGYHIARPMPPDAAGEWIRHALAEAP